MTVYFTENSPAMVELETMVDKVGIRNVMWALSTICALKACHLRDNWQDEQSARVWERDAVKLDKLAGKLDSDPATPR